MFEKMNGETPDLTKDNIDKLKQLFPEIVTDEKIDFEKLQVILGKEIDDAPDRYNFTWQGKKETMQFAQQPSKGTLRPVKEKSKDWDTTGNLYIEGDNLEVLKLLQKSYNNKVNMIMIDPPYNTGNDFVYKDDFKDSLDSYLELTGQKDGEGNKFTTNTESNGRYHTDWLNMMYPRLKLARNLLTDDGVIFISIDDNEIENLKKICNEIFGEKNFVGWIIWQHSIQPKGYTGKFSVHHNHILCYQKSDDFELGSLERTEEDNKAYNNPDNDPNGLWRSGDVRNALYRPNLIYDIISPSGKIIKPCSNGWRWSKETVEEKIKTGEIIFSTDQTRIIRKIYLKNLEGRTPETIWFSKDVGSTRDAMSELKKLFTVSPFDTPKPINLIKRMMSIIGGRDGIILDFFSGSASTAHAVMQQNANDGGNRRFIMIQLPEEIEKKSEAYKSGYHTICDIGEERIRRAGEKVKSDLIDRNKNEGTSLDNQVNPDDLDIGFKVFKLGSSNLTEWQAEFDELESNINLFESNFLDDRSELDILFEIMLKNGLDLNYPVAEISEGNHKIYDVASGNLFVCLNDNINRNVARKIAELRKEYGIETSQVVFKDSGFEGDTEKLNCYEILREAGYQDSDLLSI